jgi:hypothetical protein
LLYAKDLHKNIFVCIETQKPFLIQESEIAFYQKNNLLLPRKHPDQRHRERFSLRAWRTLFLRKCDATGEEILSVYPPEYKGKVYSQDSYTKHLYQ